MDKKYYRTETRSYLLSLILGIAAVILVIYYLGFWKDFVEISLSSGLFVIAFAVSWLINTLTYWVKYQDDIWTFRRFGKKSISIPQKDIISLSIERKVLKYQLIIRYQGKRNTRTVRLRLPGSIRREILEDFSIINSDILNESALNYLQNHV